MNLHSQQRLSAHLQKLSALLQQKQFQQVIAGVKSLLPQFKEQSDLHHLMALAYKSSGQQESAIECFQQCLKINNHQSAVHSNYANCLLSMKRYEEAICSYQTALAIQPLFFDALKNLGVTYFEIKQFNDAEDVLKKAFELKPNNASVLTQLGNIYKARELFDDAIAYYQKALNTTPNYINALHNMGLAFKLSERLNEAIQCFSRAMTVNPNVPEVHFSIANSLFEQGKYQEAEQFYWSSLNKNPKAIDVHTTLNEFYWQTGNKENFGKSFQLALQQMPTDMEIHFAYVDSLLSANNVAQAQNALSQALTIKETPKLLKTQGVIFARDNQNQKAIDAFKISLEHNFDVDVALDLISILIIEYDYAAAMELISKVETIVPHNQLLIAYKSLCWRLTDDERYEWLIDFQHYVKPYEIPVPGSYRSLESFLEELETVLLSMHTTQHEPLKQTLKHGTQTPGRLLYKPHPVISSLKQSLSTVVSEHIATLPNDSAHPLLSRKSARFEFAGSWSVKLKPQGFHVNHVHPAGWLSSSFYVNVPDFAKVPQPSEQAGAIKFGESSLFLGEREKIERVIQPNAGTLALFPSYVWHGTVPFNGLETDYRLTSPFDITPA